MGGSREACSSLPSWTERAVSQNKQTTSGAEGSNKVPAGPLGRTRPIQPAPPGCVKSSENQSQALCVCRRVRVSGRGLGTRGYCSGSQARWTPRALIRKQISRPNMKGDICGQVVPGWIQNSIASLWVFSVITGSRWAWREDLWVVREKERISQIKGSAPSSWTFVFLECSAQPDKAQ